MPQTTLPHGQSQPYEVPSTLSPYETPQSTLAHRDQPQPNEAFLQSAYEVSQSTLPSDVSQRYEVAPQNQYEVPQSSQSLNAQSIYELPSDSALPRNNGVVQQLTNSLYEDPHKIFHDHKQDEEIYWQPGSDCSMLYEQLAKRRFREILHKQIS